MIFIYDSKPIQTIQRYELDLTPRYQQGYIWLSEFKDYLLFSIIKGYPIGTIILKDKIGKNKKDDLYEVVDGQQRLITIYNFIVKDYTIKGKIEISERKKREVSLKQLRVELSEVREKGGKKLIKELLECIGANKLSDVRKEDYGKLMKKIKEVK